MNEEREREREIYLIDPMVSLFRRLSVPPPRRRGRHAGNYHRALRRAAASVVVCLDCGGGESRVV